MLKKIKKVICNDIFNDLAKFAITLATAAILVNLMLNRISEQNKNILNQSQCNFDNVNNVFFIILIAAMTISFWFFQRGKSVKAFNDFTLFLSAAISAYNYIFSHQYHLDSQNITYICSDANIFVWHLYLIIASFAKAFISFLEFISERIAETKAKRKDKNDTDKTIFLFKTCIELINILKKTR